MSVKLFEMPLGSVPYVPPWTTTLMTASPLAAWVRVTESLAKTLAAKDWPLAQAAVRFLIELTSTGPLEAFGPKARTLSMVWYAVPLAFNGRPSFFFNDAATTEI